MYWCATLAGCAMAVCVFGFLIVARNQRNHGKILDKMRADVDKTTGRINIFLEAVKPVQETKKRGRKKKDE